MGVIDPIDREIMRAMDKAAQNGVVPIYPHHVVSWLSVDMSERRVRQRMVALAEDSHIVRHGKYTGYSPKSKNDSLSYIDRQIVRAVQEINAGGVRRVHARDVIGHLVSRIHETTIRDRMARLAGLGYLYRHGYSGGYSSADTRLYKLREALARAERALKEAQILAEELARMDVMERVAA